MKNFKTTKLILIALLAVLLCYASPLAAQTSDSLSIETLFIPAGYMGCTGNIHMDNAWRIDPHSAPICTKVTYTNTCPQNWAGVFWVNRTDNAGRPNWGQYRGMDLSRRAFTRLTFWAKGTRGDEVVEFGTFGVDSRADNAAYIYTDGCAKIPMRVVLSRTWQKYTIDITSCQDMKSVIGAFYWTASFDNNPAGLVFYLDDIQFEH